MKLSVSKTPILATLVIAALAAGTALVAGYVDRPSRSQRPCAESKCNDCPRQGADTCCKVTGVCAENQACASLEPAGACCGTACCEKVEAACCPAVACCGTACCEEVEAACCPAGACCGTACCEEVEAACCPAAGCPDAK